MMMIMEPAAAAAALLVLAYRSTKSLQAPVAVAIDRIEASLSSPASARTASRLPPEGEGLRLAASVRAPLHLQKAPPVAKESPVGRKCNLLPRVPYH